jgi:hypothetical protein
MSKGKEMKFKDLLRTVIVEQSRMDVLADKLTKAEKGKKPLLTPEELFALVVADPQTKVQDGIDIDTFNNDFSVIKKVGPYAQWIIKTYLSQKPKLEDGQEFDMNDRRNQEIVRQMKSQFMEDLYKITGDLQKFDRHKSKIASEFRDINKLTPQKLYDLVKDFSMEKTKASKDEKKVASQTYEHPGAEVIFRGNNWTVSKIEDKGQLGKDAACFYGGNQLEPSRGETRWCTSAPGLSWFDRYIKDGPLYVIIPNTTEGKRGEVSGLPADRYQFHFPSGQFMDVHDRQIDLVDFLNGPMKEIKPLFKHEFVKGLTKGNVDNKELTIDYPRDSSSKYVALYGWDDLFNSADKQLTRLDFTNSSRDNLNLKFPPSLANFKDLNTFYVENAISEVPKELKGLDNIEFLSFPNNKNLKELPEWIADYPKLMALSVKGSNPDMVIPERLKEKFAHNGGTIWFVGPQD